VSLKIVFFLIENCTIIYKEMEFIEHNHEIFVGEDTGTIFTIVEGGGKVVILKFVIY